MAIRIKKLLFTVIFLAGCSCLIWGYWIPVKAHLAQILLQRAWDVSQRTDKTVKGWPWADSWPIGRLQQSRLGVDLIVLEGASGESLAFGPGHIEASDVLGGDNHSVLAGHRDTSFSFLKDLQSGDKFTIESSLGQNVYTVEHTEVVSADKLYLDKEKPLTLSLITCYPFGSLVAQSTHRYVVTAIGRP